MVDSARPGNCWQADLSQERALRTVIVADLTAYLLSCAGPNDEAGAAAGIPATPGCSSITLSRCANRPLPWTPEEPTVQSTRQIIQVRLPWLDPAALLVRESSGARPDFAYDDEMRPASSDPDSSSELVQLRRERDLYQRLLRLGSAEEIERFLEDALALIVEISGAKRGLIELQGSRERASLPDAREAVSGERPHFWATRGCSDEELAKIREALSGGVIAEALTTGQTIVTTSALEDPRFRDRQSVRENRIEAVLCAPIGADPPLGVLYLQDREQLGPFSEDDRLRAEVFAQHIATLADRLLIRRQRRAEADPTRPFRLLLRAEGLVGRSAALAKTLKQITLVAPLEVNVLLTGSSGTGKTQIARIIHDNGPRASRPFLELNCAALPEPLLENELFGALRGGHSGGAVEGKVAAARGGTLFLDEIGELRPSAQAKLLQLLQSREYFPLGSSRPVRADVRVIAATNIDLKAAVARREFREDLFFRLQVVPVRVPALAERREDIVDLAAYFCARACDVHHLPQLRLSAGAIRAAEAAEWPGNIRELAHSVEAAAIGAAGEGVLRVERRHLFPESGDGGDEPADTQLTFQDATRRFQEQLLRATLEETSWNVTETASRLDLTRSHIYNLVHAFGLERRRA
jgi:Nif-specific regulatory protein